MKLIEIIVSANGKISVETKGFAGAECQAASRHFEQAMGKRTNEVLTSDYYAHQVNDQAKEREGA